MKYNKLIECGAYVVESVTWACTKPTIKDDRWYRGRGRLGMDAEAPANHTGLPLVFRFELNHRTAHVELTEEEVKERLRLTNVTIGACTYEAFWHCVRLDDELWWHPIGWSSDSVFKENVRLFNEERMRRLNTSEDHIDVLDDEQRTWLQARGFECIVRKEVTNGGQANS